MAACRRRTAGAARKRLGCVARAGNWLHCDAPDVGAPAGRLQRAAQLSAAGYRLKGERVAVGAEDPRIGFVLGVAVLGGELAGPQHDAPVLAGKNGGGQDEDANEQGNSTAAGDSGGTGGAGWTGIATAAGAGAVVAVIAGARVRTRPARGGHADDEGKRVKRQRNRGRVTLASVAAMCAVAALPGQAHAADGPAPYAFDPGAKTVRGAETNAEASELTAGSVYRSGIKPGQKLYYRLNLDDAASAYVSAVVVPKSAGKVAYGDGITISIRDVDDTQCSSEDAIFGSGEFARPIAAYAHRIVEKGNSTCREGGEYNVLIERKSNATSSPAEWDLELRYASEPAAKGADAQATEAPENWSSASPTPPSGKKKRAGGSSVYEATGLETGEWQDSIAPGQTRFYRVPVDWGQQIFASAALSNNSRSTEYVGNALALSLENPAQGHVEDETLSYSGEPASVSLEPLPPVDYRNRFDSASDVSAMRFAGWYYLSVTLSPKVAQFYGDGAIPLRLKISVRNEAKESPYAGAAGIFGVSDEDKDMARSGQSAPQAARSDTMKVVAAAGIGTGSVLVLGLGAWTLLARRRTVPAAVPQGAGAQQQSPYGGPPQAW